ncbi:hypothetical protein FB451DRAFT_1190935 [Mycena latifolia]|nr:hypothetical protein FB451DRAFT_1190935 [Mycena latifolia]
MLVHRFTRPQVGFGVQIFWQKTGPNRTSATPVGGGLWVWWRAGLGRFMLARGAAGCQVSAGGVCGLVEMGGRDAGVGAGGCIGGVSAQRERVWCSARLQRDSTSGGRSRRCMSQARPRPGVDVRTRFRGSARLQPRCKGAGSGESMGGSGEDVPCNSTRQV